jgi:hypothetical protein
MSTHTMGQAVSTSVGSVSISSGPNPMKGLRLDSKDDFQRLVRVRLAAMGYREDAGQTMAFARALEHIIAKVYAAEFAQYKAYQLFPTNTEVGPGDLSYTYRMLSRLGNAAVVNAGNARDLPNIDLEGEEWQSQIITLGASYNFTVIDQASAGKAQIAIEAEKAKATRESIEALEEQIAAIGYAPTGTYGVTNCPGVQGIPQVSTGTWAAQLLAASGTSPTSTNPYPYVNAVSAMVTDVLSMDQAIYANTLGRHKATNLLIPPNLYGMLKAVPRSPAFTDDTALQYMERISGLELDDWAILQNIGALAGSGSNIKASNSFLTRIMVYEKNPDCMQLMIAQPFTQLAPQATNLVWEIPTFSRVGGAMSVRPLGVTFMDGL